MFQELEQINPTLACMVELLYGEGMGRRSASLGYYISQAITTGAANWAALAHRMVNENADAWGEGSLQNKAVALMENQLND